MPSSQTPLPLLPRTKMRAPDMKIWSVCIVALLLLPSALAMADEAAIHIVYTVRPEGEEPEAYHLKTLTTVLGSEEAARGSLIYSYKTVASGFSCKLTPKQVEEISKLPGVLQVIRSQTLQLH